LLPSACFLFITARSICSLPPAAFAAFRRRAKIQALKLRLIVAPYRLAVVRVEIIVNLTNQPQLFLCRQIQKPVKNNRHILIHNSISLNPRRFSFRRYRINFRRIAGSAARRRFPPFGFCGIEASPF
jgi:hypothetical protein